MGNSIFFVAKSTMFPRRLQQRALFRIGHNQLSNTHNIKRQLHNQSLTLRSSLLSVSKRLGPFSNSLLASRWTYPVSSTASIHSSPVCKQQAVVPFLLADIGEGITECELIQWFIKEGDQIQQFDKICEVQSDKATVEITSRFDGIVKKLHYKAGDIAKVGQPLIDISSSSVKAAVAGSPSPAVAASVPAASPASTAQPAVDASGKTSPVTVKSATAGTTLATPAVRRIAKENNVDLAQIQPTGKGGRVTKEDILAFVNGDKKPSTAVDAAASAVTTGAPQLVQLTPIQKAMVKSMKRSLAIPHFGFADEISFTHLRQVRAGINQYLAGTEGKEDAVDKISFMPLLLKSFSVALQRYPLLNAQFVEAAAGGGKDHLLYRPLHNIGIAVDSPNGLVVPNVQRVNEKSILEIASDLQRLRQLASRGQLPPESFQGTTITISNIGNLGGRNLHPVIPPDTVCIVAIGKSQLLPRYHPKTMELKPEELATVSFSADHRVVDGATVARFFAEWKQLLENPGRLLLCLK